MGSLDKKFKIGIVAGEQSGDQLGASLIQKIKEIEPSVEFVGVGGPQMIKEGLNSFFDMEKISVMGIVEPLKNLKEILSLRKGLKEYLINQQIDLFIGIDSPDFNFNIEAFAKAGSDVITVHVETCTHLQRTLQLIRDCGAKAGVSLNPATSEETLRYVLNDLDLVLVMSVNPGFGGQSFIENQVACFI